MGNAADLARVGASLEVLGQRARPVSLAAERGLPVLPALAPLLADGHLPRGTSVGVAGTGATALALALVGEASTAGSWTVAVGLDDLGLVAASESGVDLSRLVLVAAPSPDRWATVVAALVEAIEIVLVRPTGRVRAGEVRRLGSHLRSRGGILVRLPGPGTWPEPPDLSLRVAASTWIGDVPADRPDGAGRLRARRMTIEATGRRRAARPRRVEVWLPRRDGAVASVAVASTGSSADAPVGGDGRPVHGSEEQASPTPGWADVG